MNGEELTLSSCVRSPCSFPSKADRIRGTRAVFLGQTLSKKADNLAAALSLLPFRRSPFNCCARRKAQESLTRRTAQAIRILLHQLSYLPETRFTSFVSSIFSSPPRRQPRGSRPSSIGRSRTQAGTRIPSSRQRWQ